MFDTLSLFSLPDENRMHIAKTRHLTFEIQKINVRKKGSISFASVVNFEFQRLGHFHVAICHSKDDTPSVSTRKIMILCSIKMESLQLTKKQNNQEKATQHDLTKYEGFVATQGFIFRILEKAQIKILDQ